MRKIFRTLTVMLLCGALACPMVEARGRNDRNNGGGSHPAASSSTSSRGPGNSNSRPGNAGNNNNSRPGSAGSNNAVRPGNPGNNNNNAVRPGNAGNNNRPGGPGNMGPGNNNRPQGPGNMAPGHAPAPGHGPGHAPGHGHGPGHAPGHSAPPPAHGIHFGAPYRPLMPVARPWTRPVPPPHYNRFVGGPSIGTILGVALGTALNITINNLVTRGYDVTGYANDAVYVANVNQLNLLWPNATLYYDNGYLAASEFVYSTPYYDMNRYNVAYARLFNAYGAPYSNVPTPGGGVTTTWWGPNGTFVTLNFSVANAYNGSTRYFTTLSFGN